MKISTRILAGFIGIVTLLAIVAIVGITSLNKAKVGFRDYRSLAQQTNEAGRVQANLLTARLHVKNYVINSSQTSIDQVQERAKSTLDLLNGLDVLTADHPEMQKIVQTAASEVKTYADTFQEVIKQQKLRNTLVANKLEVLGPQIEQKVTATMKSAMEDGDAEASYKAGMFLRELLMTQLYAMKYLASNDDAAYQRVLDVFETSHQTQQGLLSSLQNPTRRQLISDSVALYADYTQSFKEVHAAISMRNTLVINTLDVIGPKVANEIEALKLDAQNDQDQLGTDMNDVINTSSSFSLFVSIGAGIAGIIAAFLIGRSISRPVLSMTTAMENLAEGNLTIDIPGQNRKDEIGNMSKAVQVFKTNAIEVKRLEEESKHLAAQAEIEKRKAMENLAQQFEASVGNVMRSVAASAQTVSNSAEIMAGGAEETSQQSATVAAAAEQASQNLQTVASATEELSASISEIGTQINLSTEVARTAVNEAKATLTTMQGLVDSANKVGEVISLITDIAEQTNLLALNATIEAARAGDAGKGFAVVANEVKNLANQTARATDEIGAQIQSIQTATQNAAEAMDHIGKTIGNMNENTSTIAAAVEQQRASTTEIASNIQQVSTGNMEVTANIALVNDAATKTGVGATNIVQASSELLQQFDQLQAEVTAFLQKVRSA